MSDTTLILGLVVVLGLVLWLSFGRDREGYDKKVSIVDLAEFDALDPELKDMYRDTIARVMSTILGKFSGGWRMLSEDERALLKKDVTTYTDKAIAQMNSRLKDEDVAKVMKSRLPRLARGIPGMAQSTLAPKKPTLKK